MIAFNTCCPSDVQKAAIILSSLKQCLGVLEADDFCKLSIPVSLCQFCRFHLVEVISKKNRKVPLLLPPDAKSGIDYLIAARSTVGIPASNPFVFVKVRRTENNEPLMLQNEGMKFSTPTKIKLTKKTTNIP